MYDKGEKIKKDEEEEFLKLKELTLKFKKENKNEMKQIEEWTKMKMKDVVFVLSIYF